MSVEKKYLKDNGVCKVTFKLPPSIAETASKANVVGIFNNWDPPGIPMKKTKTGTFSLSMELQSNNEYEFRYLVDGTRWETDFEADGVTPIPWGDEHNSVLKI